MNKLLLSCLVALLPMVTLAGPVNVNTADAETISKELKGVGITKAQAIVQYREQHGSFHQAEDLLAVKGIGQAVIRDNQGNIIISE